MKEYKYLYRKMLDKEYIRKAYKNLRKGKTKRREIQYIDAHLDEEVDSMYEMILNTRPPDVPVEHPELAFSPQKQKPRAIREHGKDRWIYMPEIHEQWFHHIIVLILEPIITATSYPYSCGSFPGRGAHYGKRQMERWIRGNSGIKYFAKFDIRHFYQNIRPRVLVRWLRVRIKDEWFIYAIMLCFKHVRKGVPLGFYISQWLANYLLEPLDRFIVEKLGFEKYVRYMDDGVFFGSNKRKMHQAIVKIRMLLGRMFRLRMKNNYQVCRFDFVKKTGRRIGRVVDYMGFIFFRDRTVIRKAIMLFATRLATKIKKSKDAMRGFYNRHVRAMLSYMGWFSCTNTYRCYEDHIKPCVVIKSLKRIVSKLQRRQNNDIMERRALLAAA